MRYRCEKSRLQGAVDIPGSKSHTIRALIIGELASGESVIEEPLDSARERRHLLFHRIVQARGRAPASDCR